MSSLDFGDGGAMIRSANDARRRRDATPLLPSEHAAQEVENARVVRLKSFRYDGRDINTDRYLILHEEVEKTLIDQLKLHYLHAHQIATRAEQAAVRAAGVRWRDYDRFMQKHVKRIGDERLTKVPADLDLKPYRDEHDYDLVQRMLASIARGQGPRGVKAKDVERAVGRYMPRMRDFKAKPERKRQGRVLGSAARTVCSFTPST
jgi:hypothetical protein